MAFREFHSPRKSVISQCRDVGSSKKSHKGLRRILHKHGKCCLCHLTSDSPKGDERVPWSLVCLHDLRPQRISGFANLCLICFLRLSSQIQLQPGTQPYPCHPPPTQALSQGKLVSLFAQNPVIYRLLPYSTPFLCSPLDMWRASNHCNKRKMPMCPGPVAKNWCLDCWRWAESPARVWPSSLLIFEEYLLPWCFCYEEVWQAILLLAPATL